MGNVGTEPTVVPLQLYLKIQVSSEATGEVDTTDTLGNLETLR